MRALSSSVSFEGCRVMPWPALLTHTSMWPNRLIASCTTRRTSSRTVTSATTVSTRAPDRDAVSLSASSRRATSTRLAPSRPSCSASAAPIPALAPVITMTLSCTMPPDDYYVTLERVDPTRGRSRAGARPPREGGHHHPVRNGLQRRLLAALRGLHRDQTHPRAGRTRRASESRHVG